MQRLLAISLFILSSVFANAQLNQPCVDLTIADSFFQCNDPSFLPVCGCDNKTYRNECTAFRNGGVTQIQYDGVCMNDYFYAIIYPTLAQDAVSLYLQFYDKGPVLIQIRSTFGLTVFSQYYPTVDSRQFTFDAGGYKPGVYFMVIQSGNVGKVIKFVKM